MGSIYSIMALGFALIYRGTRIFHIAHGSVFIWAGYAAYVSHVWVGVSPWMAALIAMLAGSALGMAMEWGIYRQLDKRNSNWNVLFLASLGIYIILTNVAAMLFGSAGLVLRRGAGEVYKLGTIQISQMQVAEIVALIIIAIVLYNMLHRTKEGMAIFAVCDNQQLTEALGNDNKRTRTVIFLIASALASLAGVLNAFDVGVNPNAGMGAVLAGAVAVMVAGRSIMGALAGGLLIGLAQSVVIIAFSAKWQEMTTFLILALVLIFRPEGIFTIQKRSEEG